MTTGMRVSSLLCIAVLLAGCGLGSGGGNDARTQRQLENLEQSRIEDRADTQSDLRRSGGGRRLFDFLRNDSGDPERQINVNRHLWAASLDILSFLPFEAADPFSGVISTDWGRVSGSSAVYRATVLITGPALDARSLRVAVFRQSGGRSVPVDDEVATQIEDSILTRARQIRLAETN